MKTLQTLRRIAEKILLFLLAAFLFKLCQPVKEVEEVEIIPIRLEGKLNNYKAEISGLDWFDDHLILMPENPESFSDQHWYTLEKKGITDFIDGISKQPIVPQEIKLYGDFSQILPGYEGFEALAFSGDTVYAVIELQNQGRMSARLVKGRIDLSDRRIIFDTLISAQIPIAENLTNIGVESIIIIRNEIFLIYEANGKNISASPHVYKFDKDLNYLDTVQFPTIEYRITDATRIDDKNRFWVINYHYPGDSLLLPESDKFVSTINSSDSDGIERLINLEYMNDEFRICSDGPVWLKMATEGNRNWEGLVRLDNRGFIIVNDEFPRKTGTILAFVKFPLNH